jgi:methylthioribose-1-phosphate isomerase
MNRLSQTVWWNEGVVCLIDQRLLPTHHVIARCETVDAVAMAIRSMQVRGAPAIGCTAAYGMALAGFASPATTSHELLKDLLHAKKMLDATRPTAVNLSWATQRMLAAAHGSDIALVRQVLLQEANTIVAEDLAMCHAIGAHGMTLIPERGRVLTHCNAGGLATAGYGTALAPIRSAFATGRSIHVLVDETRPFLQGARLTAWELQRDGIPLTLITDSMAGYFMQKGEVDCVIVGADRVVANGDIANKIGTYSLAVLAHAHQIPFYVAVPSSTIDLSLPNGAAIPIEQRDATEVTSIAGVVVAPEGVQAAHPAFDVTPHQLITAIITEQGVLFPPFTSALKTHMQVQEV